MLQENEMREFFNRVIGDFTGLTEAANKVEGLTQRVQELSERVDALVQENENLRRDLNSQIDYARSVEERASRLQDDLNASHEHAKVLQETIVSADSRVVELTTQADINAGALAHANEARTVAENSVRDYEVLTADLRQQLSDTTNERDDWQKKAQDHETTINALNATLSRVQSILNPPAVVEFPQYNVG